MPIFSKLSSKYAMKLKESSSVNFTATEKYILLNIIYNYRNVLENNKSDAHTWKSKQETWKKIENCFNALSDHNIYRTAKSLKAFYEDRKKNFQLAEERSEMLKPGGGALTTTNDSTTELFLDVTNDNFVTDELDSAEEVAVEDVICNTNKHGVNNENSEEVINLQLLNTNWENHSAPELQQPVNVKSSEKVKIPKPERVKPNAVAPDITKKYINLAKVKSEVANLQRNILLEERRTRNVEAALREESLKLDIEIKRKQLQILTGMARRHGV